MGDNTLLVPVVSYARISDDGEHDGHGVANQHRTNRRTAARLGWTIVREITDNDLSASKAQVVRGGFEEIVGGFPRGRLADGTEFIGAIVLAEDRLVRRAGDYERFVESLTAKPGRRFADERGEKDLYCETVEGMGLVGVAFSKMEARKVQRRMRQWHRDRAQDGRPAGGTRPFGWRDDRLILEPAEATLLRTAAVDFIAGRSLNSIVRDWQRHGATTSLGHAWTARSLRVTLGNPRLCGWRRIGDELVRDDDGAPVVGQWEPVITPEQWQAIDAIMTARRGRQVGQDGRPADELPADHREHTFLLGGILRCGKPQPDGTPCNTRLRVSHQRDCAQHLYTCPTKGQGGCGGLGRRGDKVDEYVTELVLTRLEERQAEARDTSPWLGDAELTRVEAKLAAITAQWQRDQISDDLFFGTVRQLEARQAELRNQRNRHEVTAQRAKDDVIDVRRRWRLTADEGGLDLTQKRRYIREVLHAVVILPAGKGNGSRGTFNPDLLVPKWR